MGHNRINDENFRRNFLCHLSAYFLFESLSNLQELIRSNQCTLTCDWWTGRFSSRRNFEWLLWEKRQNVKSLRLYGKQFNSRSSDCSLLPEPIKFLPVNDRNHMQDFLFCRLYKPCNNHDAEYNNKQRPGKCNKLSCVLDGTLCHSLSHIFWLCS